MGSGGLGLKRLYCVQKTHFLHIAFLYWIAKGKSLTTDGEPSG